MLSLYGIEVGSFDEDTSNNKEEKAEIENLQLAILNVSNANGYISAVGTLRV